jgi:hypothetical protein
MKVLHIPPSFENKPRWKQLFYYPLRQQFDFWGTPGFFYASFYDAFDNIDRRSAEWVLENYERVNREYDFVLADLRLDTKFYSYGEFDTVHKNLTRKITIPKILFEVSDRASEMRPDAVLDGYDLVFKREPYRDRSRYDLSEGNKSKIRATMLACPFVFHPAHSIFKPLKKVLEPRPINEAEYHDQSHDVFFSGMISPRNKIREKAWRALVDASEIKTRGGLQNRSLNNKKQVKQDDLHIAELSRREYVEAIRNSKISLALDGLGEFTFRHLELWYMGAFMICSPNIKEQELPLPAQEGKHYVAYNDVHDLVEKVRYYSAHDEERLKIARSGRKMFKEFYNTQVHGFKIKEEVINLI